MNTTKIYYAQLNVSKLFTVDSITKLIERLQCTGDEVCYNIETKSIDIEIPKGTASEFNDNIIRDELKEWVKELPAEQSDIDTICDNINFVFNITKIGAENSDIVKLYLY